VYRLHSAPRFPLLLAPLLCSALALILALAIALALPAAAARASYVTGIGDQQPAMFTNPLYQRLGTKIARDIVPYDVVERPEDLATFEAWYESARADGVTPLVAFYHSRVTPLRMPSVGVYRKEIAKFISMFPAIRSYQPWNEANRGYVAGQFASPSAVLSAKYYLALKSACRGCQVVGLDVLDGASIKPTITYIKRFQATLSAAHSPLPTIWGLHNYSDTNRLRSSGTRAVLKAVSGQVWLTETGGIVQFGTEFTNKAGKGLLRAAKALRYMFKLAASSSRIKRLYIFQWTGSGPAVRFDAGLIGPEGAPRPGYLVVCQHLLGAHAAACSSSASVGGASAPSPAVSPSGAPAYGTPESLHVLPPLSGGLPVGGPLLSS
jgi:hypothetical protein